MKKRLMLLFAILSISSFAIETASEFDPYSTKEPGISTGFKKAKNNIKSTFFYHENDSYRILTRAGYISTIILNHIILK